MKFIVALNKRDKSELDFYNFKYITSEKIVNDIFYYYENDKNKISKLSDKTKFLFTDVMFV